MGPEYFMCLSLAVQLASFKGVSFLFNSLFSFNLRGFCQPTWEWTLQFLLLSDDCECFTKDIYVHVKLFRHIHNQQKHNQRKPLCLWCLLLKNSFFLDILQGNNTVSAHMSSFCNQKREVGEVTIKEHKLPKADKAGSEVFAETSLCQHPRETLSTVEAQLLLGQASKALTFLLQN